MALIAIAVYDTEENQRTSILNELFDKWGSDKGAFHGPAHGYGPIYEALTKNRNIECLIEVGVEFGNSLMAWGEAFPDAAICGIDRVLPTGFTLPNGNPVKLEYADQNRVESFWENDVIQEDWPMADIIIDDGGHCMNHHWVTLAGLWRKLKPGGIYVIEDVHTCNLPPPSLMYGQPLQNDCITTLDVLYSWKALNMLYSWQVLVGEPLPDINLYNPWVEKQVMDKICNEVERIAVFMDNQEIALFKSEFESITKHGLAVIFKK